MTLFFPDISGYQAGIDLRGALFVAIKVTEGTTYVNPDLARAKANARSHGTWAMGYHFLHAGNAAAQAKWYFQHAGTMPCMVDCEATAGSNPGVGDITTFVDALRKLGGRVHLVYLPHWYWEGTLRSPDLGPLRQRNLWLWSSAYTGYTDSDSGTGWQPYGGSHPLIWQYTSSMKFNGRSVDFSAYRGRYGGLQDAESVKKCLADLESIARDGHEVKAQADPPKPTAHLQVGPTAGDAPLTVTATDTGSTPGSGTISSIDVGWGDGTGVFHKTGTHTYTGAGKYTVVLRVHSSNGQADEATATVEVGGMFRHVVPHGNTQSLTELAASRNTTALAVCERSLTSLSVEEAAVFSAYMALDAATSKAGLPHPPMPEGMVYLTVHGGA